MQEGLLMLLNLYVLIAAKYLFKTVQSMEKTSYSLNANFAVVLPNGSAGEIPISVNHATSGNAMATT